MQIKIHRGAKEIGGSCLEISTEKARILVDFGLPLVNDDGSSFNFKNITKFSCEELIEQGVLPDIKGLYSDEGCDISAIFISHAHPDHFGLLKYINSKIKVFLSEVSYSIIKEISPILYDTSYELNNFEILKNGKPVEIEDISIKPHTMDHSIPSSFAFEITADNKKVLYTGDFRAHGRTSYNLNKLVDNVKNSIDYLILEGTTIGREKVNNLTENDVKNKLTDAFKNEILNIVVFSAQNLDRFISVYKACLNTKKTLVIDPYTAFTLEKFKSLGENIPQFDWNNIKIYFSSNSITRKLAESKDLYKYKSQKISTEEILSHPESYVVKDNYKITTKILEEATIDDIQVIYSLWSGYLEKEDNFWNTYKDKVIHIHTSGHAYPQDLKNFVTAINPTTIIPIHTSFPEAYREMFGENTFILEDKELLKL